MNVFQPQMLGRQSSVSSGRLTYSQGWGERCRASGLLPELMTVKAAGGQGGNDAPWGSQQGPSNHISMSSAAEGRGRRYLCVQSSSFPILQCAIGGGGWDRGKCKHWLPNLTQIATAGPETKKVKDGGPGERKPGRSRMQSKAGGGGEIGDVSYSCAGSLKYTWVQAHNRRSQG